MRLHTNNLTAADVYKAVRDLPNVYAEVSTHGSRSRARALEVKLTGNSSRRPNFGTARNVDRFYDGDHAATWDEWGIMFARLFELDPTMVAGTVKYPAYADAADYHRQTGDRFRTLRWEDQHANHTWRPTGTLGESACKCGAVRRFA